MSDQPKLAIKLRKFNRVCPITGYREEAIKIGVPVIVQTDRGVEYGEIIPFRHALFHDVVLKKVIRYATFEDVEKEKHMPEMEAKAFASAVQKAKEHELPVKVINLEYLFDATRAIVYYKLGEGLPAGQAGKKAPNLRDFSRDLSAALSVRVDTRQVSPRDEARLFGGLGPCGRSLCCSVWLERPKHVTVKMAKEQGLSVSSAKTSGMCGRLMCCLEYEYGK